VHLHPFISRGQTPQCPGVLSPLLDTLCAVWHSSQRTIEMAFSWVACHQCDALILRWRTQKESRAESTLWLMMAFFIFGPALQYKLTLPARVIHLFSQLSLCARPLRFV